MTRLFTEHADLEREVLLEAREEALRAERVAMATPYAGTHLRKSASRTDPRK